MMLFKLGTGGKADRTRRQAAGDWYTKVRLAPYDFQKARLCRDKGTSASWAEMLQAAVDRRAAGEPADLDTLKNCRGGCASALSWFRRCPTSAGARSRRT